MWHMGWQSLELSVTYLRVWFFGLGDKILGCGRVWLGEGGIVGRLRR